MRRLHIVPMRTSQKKTLPNNLVGTPSGNQTAPPLIILIYNYYCCYSDRINVDCTCRDRQPRTPINISVTKLLAHFSKSSSPRSMSFRLRCGRRRHHTASPEEGAIFLQDDKTVCTSVKCQEGVLVKVNVARDSAFRYSMHRY